MASISDIEEKSDAKSFETGASFIDSFEAITYWSLCARLAICLFLNYSLFLNFYVPLFDELVVRNKNICLIDFFLSR